MYNPIPKTYKWKNEHIMTNEIFKICTQSFLTSLLFKYDFVSLNFYILQTVLNHSYIYTTHCTSNWIHKQPVLHQGGEPVFHFHQSRLIFVRSIHCTTFNKLYFHWLQVRKFKILVPLAEIAVIVAGGFVQLLESGWSSHPQSVP